MVVDIKAIGTRDLLTQLQGPNAARFFHDAKSKRRSLSALLEDLAPTDADDARSGMDAFTRLMAEAAGVVAFGAFTGKAALVLHKKGCTGATTGKLLDPVQPTT